MAIVSRLRMFTSRWPLLAGCALLLGGVGGCGGETVYPVEGQVRFKEDGKPFVGAMVIFEPKSTTGEPHRNSSRGVADENGHFRLTTFKEGDGAFEGVNRVLVAPPSSGKGDIERPGSIPEVVHPKYRAFDTSKLEFTVTRDKTQNEFLIVVERPPKE